MKVELPSFECQRCGHKWHPKKEQMPVCCAFCKSPYWNIASDKPSEALAKHSKECVPCRDLQ